MKTVLLLDDARLIRCTYAEIIRKAGFEVLTAASTEEGLQTIIDHGLPDLIVTDIMLPGASGIDFCKSMRTVNQQTPILVMSALSDKNLVVEAKDLGVLGWMLKPVEPEYFLNQLRAALESDQALST